MTRTRLVSEATAESRYTRRALLPVHVGDANGLITSSLSDGVATDGNLEARHNLAAGVSEIQYVYVNHNTTDDGPNPITVRAGFLLNGGYRPLFFGGKRDAVIEPGGRAVTDPLPISTLGDAFFESRTRVTVQTAGQKWPITYLCATGRSEWAVSGTAGDDFTTAGNNSSNALAGYGPVAVIAKTAKTDRDVVACIGDSITAGTGAANPTQQSSFSRLAVAAKGKVGINVGLAGSSSGTAYGFAFGQRANAILGATHSIELYGTNDIGSLTLAVLQSRLVNCWRDRAARGVRVYACTLPPRVTTTDAYATTANQTDATGNTTVRVPLNDWLRAGAPVDTSLAAVAIGTSGALLAGQAGHPLIGLFETADAVESARNSAKWKADGTANKYTADGIHPSAFAHQAMADAIVAQWPARF